MSQDPLGELLKLTDQLISHTDPETAEPQTWKKRLDELKHETLRLELPAGLTTVRDFIADIKKLWERNLAIILCLDRRKKLKAAGRDKLIHDIDLEGRQDRADQARYLLRLVWEKLQAERKKQRLRYDDETLTITLDDQEFRSIPPKTYQLYKTIAEMAPSKITTSEIRNKYPRQYRGDKAVRNALNRLPAALKTTIKSNNKGYWLTLPPPKK
jgi:hypothetical protein